MTLVGLIDKALPLMTEHENAVFDPYAAIATQYDLEHDGFDDDISLIVQLAESGLTPVLELGCGTGRIVEALVENKIEVTGLDISEPMLDAARKRLEPVAGNHLATFVHGDMRSPATLGLAAFGLVVYSLNALMHLETSQDQLASLDSVRQTLKPEGVVIIDVMNPHPEQLVHLGSGVILEGSWAIESGKTVDKWSHRSIHAADQTIETDIWYDTIHSNGELRRIKTSFVHRYVHPNELRLMLERTGYEEIVFYGSYDLDPFDDDSDRLIALARRTAV